MQPVAEALARDIMTSDVIAFSPETTAGEVINALLEHKISGAPVIDRDNSLVGVISEFQLLVVAYDRSMRHTPIRELMTTDVFSVAYETPITKIVDLLVLHRIRRVPVVNEGRLVGLISRRDILRYVAGQDSEKADAELRNMIVRLEPRSSRVASLALM